MKKTITFLLLLATAGCSVAIKAELLNPLNKSGRVEHSEPVQSPTPTPTPGATK